VSELRAPREQGYAGPAQFKTFVTKPDAVPHHDRIFVQGLSAALSAPASTANTPQYIARPFDLKSSSDPPLFIELFVFLSAGQQLATRPGDARETAMVQSEFSLGRSL